ncbi:MAG TPA: DUF898 domain-containing protein [Treponema sp.]|nr:DUF898 domain-containing protein [Treponema sp.]
MKERFSCSLDGNMWWKPFLGFIILSFAFTIPIQKATNSLDISAAPSVILSAFLFIIVLSLVFSGIQAAFYVLLARIALPSITFKEKSFSFTGSVGEFVSLNLVCTGLTIVTLGFYLPWYYTRINRYFFSHIAYNGKPAGFLGNPKNLIKPFLLGLILPLVLWSFAFAFVFLLAEIYNANNLIDIANTFYMLSSLIYLSIIFLFIPFMYYFLKWIVNITWKEFLFTWKAEFWKSCFFIAGRVFLVIITLGIYFPAFMLSVWEYFVERVVIEKENIPVARFAFIREKGTDFKYLWIQILLSLVTVGIYLPWAYANCIRFFAEKTFFQDEQLTLPEKK